MEDFTKQDEAYRAYQKGFAAGVRSVTDNNVGDKMTPTVENTADVCEWLKQPAEVGNG